MLVYTQSSVTSYTSGPCLSETEFDISWYFGFTCPCSRRVSGCPQLALSTEPLFLDQLHLDCYSLHLLWTIWTNFVALNGCQLSLLWLLGSTVFNPSSMCACASTMWKTNFQDYYSICEKWPLYHTAWWGCHFSMNLSWPYPPMGLACLLNFEGFMN